MDRSEEFRFVIDAYTPETMPMDRLASYLVQLAKMLGEQKSVHLLRLDPGSTQVLHRVETEAVPKVRQRIASVRSGDGPRDAMEAYSALNKLLSEDNGCGRLADNKGAEIIQFPGRRDSAPEYTISQAGVIDGELVSIGGSGERIWLRLRTADDEKISSIAVKRPIAKKLANHLFELVRLHGTGKWMRSVAGAWSLQQFTVDRFEPFDSRSLSNIVKALRDVPGGEWPDNAIDELLRQRRANETIQ